MSKDWWTLVLETGKDEAPLAQRESPEHRQRTPRLPRNAR